MFGIQSKCGSCDQAEIAQFTAKTVQVPLKLQISSRRKNAALDRSRKVRILREGVLTFSIFIHGARVPETGTIGATSHEPRAKKLA